MLSRLVVRGFKVVAEIALWILLFIFTIGGVFVAYRLLEGGLMLAVLGFFAGFVLWITFSTLTFGFILIIIDIRDRLENLERIEKSKTTYNAD